MWGFSGREAYDRRVYFWNLMAGVLWMVSLSFVSTFNVVGAMAGS